ncbi:hypothetical protein NCCP2716_10730 [Sporosarcina sp. NCCP-2716]|nr:hypothetical protein NCCP2716_10730 [Sporosarcina sp. NCCP-2716]
MHSVFQNGANIRMGDWLFFIGTAKNGQLPFGVHLSGGDLYGLLQTIDQDDRVTWKPESRKLIFGSTGWAVTLAESTPFQWPLTGRPVPADVLRDNLTMLASILLAQPMTTGLGIEVGEFLSAYLEDAPPAGKTDQRIRELIAAVQSADETGIEAVLRFFLGRGQGLTPSGDDHLVGLLSIDKAADILSGEMRSVLRSLVEIEQLTTDIGREYLLYALDGDFTSTVVRAASALTEKTDIYMLKPLLSELIDMGHSSGIDTVFGMLLGLLALRRKQECQKK